MTPRYFSLHEDGSIPDRWWLSGIRRTSGAYAFDWPYLGLEEGPGVASPGLRVFVQSSGQALDVSFTSNGSPVLSEKAADIFRTRVPEEVRLVPVEIDAQPGRWFLLHAPKVIPCIDVEESEEMHRVHSFVVTEGNPEDWEVQFEPGYRFVLGPRLNASQVGDARIFRPEECQNWLVVHEELRKALEQAGVTGLVFQEVSDVRSLTPEERAPVRRAREAWQQAWEARDAFFNGLGRRRPKRSPRLTDHFPFWPRGRGDIRVIHRPGGRLLLVTDGMSDPLPGSASPSWGLELAVETDEPQTVPGEGWPLALLQWAATRVAEDAALRALLTQHEVVATLGVPSELPSLPSLDNSQGDGGVLFGMKTEALPERFSLPLGEVRLITVKPLLGTELNWLLAERGTTSELAARMARTDLGHLSRAERAPVVEGPTPPMRPAAPAPFPRYFSLTESSSFRREVLGDVLEVEGRRTEDTGPFREGKRLSVQGGVNVPVKTPGESRDYALMDLTIPVVSAQVAEVFRTLAPEETELIPATLGERPESAFLLNVTRTVRCIDDEFCNEALRWTEEEGGPPEGWGAYSAIFGMRIRVRPAGTAKVFRPWGWPFALIVTEEIKDALEKVGATGMRFMEVACPRQRVGERLAEQERARLHQQEAGAARDEAWRTLGTLDEAYAPFDASGVWPGGSGQRRILRPEGRTLWVTHGLSSTFTDELTASVGIGFELALETADPWVNDEEPFAYHLPAWPARLLHAVGDEVARDEVRRTLLVEGALLYEVRALGLPAALLTPEETAVVLLEGAQGTEGTLPAYISLPAGEVRLVTVRILLPEEWAWLRQGKGTEKELLQRFAEAGIGTVFRAGRKSVV
jgi:hypothetical protein